MSIGGRYAFPTFHVSEGTGAMEAFRVTGAKQVGEVVTWAAAEEQPLEIVGGHSKRGLGRAMQVGHRLDVSAIAGIGAYEPGELVLTAAAATPVAEIERALNAERQMLAFEPPDWRVLLGTEDCVPTLAGLVSCNLAGPRRVAAGAARDHLLGFHAVNGRGELFKSGGKVVKNVTGYDLCKLVSGAYGTLGVLTELSIKVLPRPETVQTILVFGMDSNTGIAALTNALNSPHELSATAHLPANVAQRSTVPAVSDAGTSVTALRVEGPAPSTAFRVGKLIDLLRHHGPNQLIGDLASRTLWQEIGNVLFLADNRTRAVWRLSVAPSYGHAVALEIARQLDIEYFFDWGGGLLWVSVDPMVTNGGAAVLRRAVAAHGGGHAMLVRAPDAIRASAVVFEPLPAPLAALTLRVKESFDPRRILNPSRMYAGI
jgi:glycolate oxidase FAD binding subunit